MEGWKSLRLSLEQRILEQLWGHLQILQYTGLQGAMYLFDFYCLKDHRCNLALWLQIQHRHWSLLQHNTCEMLGKNTQEKNLHRSTSQTQLAVKSGRSLSPSDSFLFSQLLGEYKEKGEKLPRLHYCRKKTVPKRKMIKKS